MYNPLTHHQTFTPDEFEDQYNLRLGRPDLQQTVIVDWSNRSESAQTTLNCILDTRYSDGTKQKLDVYSCGDATAPTLIYIHGGYWQSGDKSIYGFLAQPFVEHGVNVVVIGYDLCPLITITMISEEAREAVAYIWQNSASLSINRDRIVVMGHSAGGHITQMMMGTDWPAFSKNLPKDLIKAGIAISPLSLLDPVRLTESLNAGIRMDATEAEAQSPMINHPPLGNAPQTVVVGGAETDEFHRQAHMYVDAFGNEIRSVELYIVPDVDHFDELNVLADSSSEFFRRTMTMLLR
jgi:arylformamidase